MTHFIDDFPGRIIKTDKGSFLYYGGTAYLGLQTHKEFQNVLINAVKKYGTNYGASRKSNIQFSVFEKAEHYLAEIVGAEACCTLSSGYMASQLVSHYFFNKTYTIYPAPHTHNSLLQVGQTPFSSYDQLKKALEKNPPSQIPVIFLDSIDFSGINYPDFNALKKIDVSKCIIVIDDSHGLGILGENGGGIYKRIKSLHCIELIVCGSLGKGFGIQGGAVFGSEERIKTFTETAFFGSASPASPAAMATLIKSRSIVKKQQDKLIENLEYFKGKLKHKSLFLQFGNHPTFTFFDEKLTEYLYQNKIIVTSFNYPKNDSSLMSRIVLSAHHTKNDMEQLLKILNAY